MCGTLDLGTESNHLQTQHVEPPTFTFSICCMLCAVPWCLQAFSGLQGGVSQPAVLVGQISTSSLHVLVMHTGLWALGSGLLALVSGSRHRLRSTYCCFSSSLIECSEICNLIGDQDDGP